MKVSFAFLGLLMVFGISRVIIISQINKPLSLPNPSPSSSSTTDNINLPLTTTTTYKRTIVTDTGEIKKLSACDSFYDYVCLQDETTWNSLERDKTFTPLIRNNQYIIRNIIKSLPFYNHCINNDFTIEKTYNAKNNISSVDELIQLFLSNRWGFPVTLKITQAMHLPVYSIELNVEVEIYNYLMAISSLNEHNLWIMRSKHGLTNNVKQFLLKIYGEYMKIQLENDNKNQNNQTQNTNDMIQNFVNGYAYLNQTKTISERWKNIIYNIVGERESRQTLFHVNNNGYFYNYFIDQLDGLDEQTLNDLATFLRDFTLNSLYYLMDFDQSNEGLMNSSNNDIRHILMNEQYFKEYKDIMSLNTLLTYSDIMIRLRRIYKDLKPSQTRLRRIYKDLKPSRREQEEVERKEIKCIALTKTIMLHKVNSLFYDRLTKKQEKLNNQSGDKKYYYLLKISTDIRNAIRGILHDSNWVSQTTKQAAYKKLDNIEFYILNPPQHSSKYERLLDSVNSWDSGVNTWLYLQFKNDLALIKRGNFLEDRKRLDMKMYREVAYDTVNAWYDPTQNTITIPPGITQWPIYHGDIKRYDLSSIGAILGHELGHSIDNQGRYFDENGSWIYSGWWSKKDKGEFQQRIECLASDYGHPCHSDLYGYHTMGEDMADQMGVRASLRVFLNNITIPTAVTGDYDDIKAKKEYVRDFFVNYARIWCARNTRDTQCEQVTNDVHALPKHRVDKTLRQLHQFSDIFQCDNKNIKGRNEQEKNTKGMINDKRCVIY